MRLRRRVRHRPQSAESELASPVDVIEAAEPRPDEPLLLRRAAVPPLLPAHAQRGIKDCAEAIDDRFGDRLPLTGVAVGVGQVGGRFGHPWPYPEQTRLDGRALQLAP